MRLSAFCDLDLSDNHVLFGQVGQSDVDDRHTSCVSVYAQVSAALAPVE